MHFTFNFPNKVFLSAQREFLFIWFPPFLVNQGKQAIKLNKKKKSGVFLLALITSHDLLW